MKVNYVYVLKRDLPQVPKGSIAIVNTISPRVVVTFLSERRMSVVNPEDLEPYENVVGLHLNATEYAMELTQILDSISVQVGHYQKRES